jgi:outer membrane lipoprotein-sorting protein
MKIHHIFYCILTVMLSAHICPALDTLEIVRKGDEVINAPEDAYIYNSMLIIDKDGNKSERTSEMFQKGADTRLIRFLTPADQNGISLLTLPDDRMYLYLPAFRKIRQIASHVKNQNFAGTDLTYDDLSHFGFAKNHTARFLREEQDVYVIELRPHDSSGKDYSFLHVFYQKNTFYPVLVEYYDSAGKLWKTIARKDVRKIKDYWVSMKMEVHNLEKDHSTISTVEKIELDTGLDESVFTKRNLIHFR